MWWESDDEWLWPFEPFLKIETTLCKYWTSIRIKISMTCVFKEYEVEIKMIQEQWLQLFYSFKRHDSTLKKHVKKHVHLIRWYLFCSFMILGTSFCGHTFLRWVCVNIYLKKSISSYRPGNPCTFYATISSFRKLFKTKLEGCLCW